MILAADLHLTDNPRDEYRWRVFGEIRAAAAKTGFHRIGLLGDIADRKDRHSAELVNRFIAELQANNAAGLETLMIMGNHDAPMRGIPFWDFINSLDCNAIFMSEPGWIEHGNKRELWLPFTPCPREEWDGIDMAGADVIFMHQPLNGSRVEHGRQLDFDDKLPPLPKGVPMYAGDIHVHQIVKGVEYVGAPHPIKFGDDYNCRLLMLNNNYRIGGEWALSPPVKQNITISIGDDFSDDMPDFRPGDQVQIKVEIQASELPMWAEMQERLLAKAQAMGIIVNSIEGVMAQGVSGASKGAGLAEMQPAEALAAFAQQQALAPAYAEAGAMYLSAAILAGQGVKQ